MKNLTITCNAYPERHQREDDSVCLTIRSSFSTALSSVVWMSSGEARYIGRMLVDAANEADPAKPAPAVTTVAPQQWLVCDDMESAPIGYRAIVEQDGTVVCLPSPMGEEKANLIAVAPLMYEALKGLVDKLRGWPMPGMREEYEAAVIALIRAETGASDE